MYASRCTRVTIGWLWLVGSLKTWVSFCRIWSFYRALLQKRSVFFGNLLIVATSYPYDWVMFTQAHDKGAALQSAKIGGPKSTGMYSYTNMYIYLYVYVYMNTRTHTRTRTRTHKRKHTRAHTHTHIYCIYTYMYVCICISIYIYMCTHMYI